MELIASAAAQPQPLEVAVGLMQSTRPALFRCYVYSSLRHLLRIGANTRITGQH